MPIRVMVVDDSAVVRGLIAKALESDPDISVVARAQDGQAALMQMERAEIDVIVLDLEMPVMDGLTALPLILARAPEVRVIIASTLTQRNARLSLQLLQSGASDYVSKPEGGSLVNAESFNRDLLAKVKALGGASQRGASQRGSGQGVSGAAPAPSPAPVVQRPVRASNIAPRVIVIGGSTGAPPALMQLFDSLKGGPDLPILVAQHMPAMFTAMLAEQLTRAGGRPCHEAVDGEQVLAGRAYVAPGGWHMTVARTGQAGSQTEIIRLNQDPPEHFCRPAVDPLLRSVAETYGAAALAVILTGMGSDGALGCQILAQGGGRFSVQDEASSVVWGMPGAAARTGLAEAVLPVPELGAWLKRAAAASSGAGPAARIGDAA